MPLKKLNNLSISQSIFLLTYATLSVAIIIASIIYYIIFNSTTKTLIADHSRELNKQIILNYENYVKTVTNTTNFIQEKIYNYDAKKDHNELQSIFKMSANVQNHIQTIVLLDNYGNPIINGDETKDVTTDIVNKKYFYNAINDTSYLHFSNPHYQDIYNNSKYYVITVTKGVYYTYEGKNYKGVLLIDLKFDELMSLSLNTNLGENGFLIILNQDDDIVYSSNKNCTKNQCNGLEIAKKTILGSRSTLLDGNYLFLDVNSIFNTRWRLATFLNVSNVIAARNQMNLTLLLILMIGLISIIFVTIFINKRVSKPLVNLKKVMSLIEKGDFNYKVELSGNKEVVVVSNAFNSMIDEIKNLMNKLMTEQKEKRKTELQALQNQINPHFLYNTLDSIIWLAENNRNKDVITTVEALSKLFRISLSKGKNFINVNQELEHVHNYLKIQQVRYNNRFTYEIMCPDNVKDLTVMKLILQPLAENAIHHGISLDEICEIKIEVTSDERYLYFEVINTGYGITPDKINQIYQNIKENTIGSGVGLRNVFQRLKIYYGDSADLIITSTLDEFTSVKLVIPRQNG